jgi:ketohexokinase
MRILAVGVATLDIINRVDVYPEEDQEIRALAQQCRRGGNACNTLTVLSRLGHQCSWAGMLADDPSSTVIRENLSAARIDFHLAQVETGGVTPTSYITSSRATGSRTIIHYRELSEYDDRYFAQIDLSAYDWLHFEGRNPQSTLSMMRRVREEERNITISIEFEKNRQGLEKCLPYADVVMISRAYALANGCEDAYSLFALMASVSVSALRYLAWGDQGGWLQDAEGTIHYLPAFKPPLVVDTLGAGDVFNAGVIHALCQQDDPLEALRYAIRIAGEKCAREGL